MEAEGISIGRGLTRTGSRGGIHAFWFTGETVAATRGLYEMETDGCQRLGEFLPMRRDHRKVMKL